MTGLEIIAVNAAIGLAVGLVKLATRKKPDDPVQATREPGTVAFPSDGTPIGAVFGTVFIEDPNILAWLATIEQRVRVNGGRVLGDRLRANVVFGLCLGPIDWLIQVELDGAYLTGPDGTANPSVTPGFNPINDGPLLDLSATSHETVGFEADGYYGFLPNGDAPQYPNSVGGYLTAYSGLQTTADLVADIVPSDTGAWDPATQGAFAQIACVRLSGPTGGDPAEEYEAFNHGIGKAALGKWAFWVSRTSRRSFGAPQWYESRSRIVCNPELGAYYDMNPAHIIHELITDEGWGLGLPLDIIDDNSFRYAAAVLYDESFGMSFRLNSSQSAASVIDEVLRVIDGVLVETGAGTLKLKLIRELPTLEGLRVIDMGNAGRVTWVETSIGELPTSIALTYWSAFARRDRVYTLHNEASIQQLGRKVVQETRAFGITSAGSVRRLAARELQYATRPRATVEVDAHLDAVIGLERGDAFVVDWEYDEPTIFRAMDIDWGNSDSEYVRIQATEDIFHERGEWQPEPEPSGHTNPVGSAIDLAYDAEQLPYWIWDRAHGNSIFGLPDLISPTPPTTDNRSAVWQGRAIVYGVRPRYDQSGFVVAEQMYDEGATAGVGQVHIGPQSGWTPSVGVALAHTRDPLTTTEVHPLALDIGDWNISVGDVLRVPVVYPVLDFSAAPTVYEYDYAHLEDSFEYVLVVDVSNPGPPVASVSVVRGLFDTMPAPTIAKGGAYVVGHIGCQEYVAAADWFDADVDTWNIYAGLTGTHEYLAPGADDGDLTLDVRALGATRIDQQEWGDVASNPLKLISEIDSASGAGFVARAARPIAAGGCSVSESGGDYTITAEPRDRTRRILAPSGLDRTSILQLPTAVVPAVEDGRTFECHVFGDDVWLGVKTFNDATGEFTVSAADLTGWGGPFAKIEFAILTAWKTDPPKPVASWSYAYLRVDP